MTQQSTEIVAEEPLVSPADPRRVLEVMRRFEDFKRQALTLGDYVVLDVGKEKRPYIKKSGWMKYALACQLSLEKRDERLEDRADGCKVYHYTYRAVAPNGRYADAVGSASTAERVFAHPDHDVRALAQTRACNRAISNLVAGGEVSAEEMISDMLESGTTKPQSAPLGVQHSPGDWSVPITPNQVSPESIRQGVRQFPLSRDLKSFGMVNTLGEETAIVPERPIPTDTALIDGFLLRKVIVPLAQEHDLDYVIQRADNGLLKAILIRGRLSDAEIKELMRGARWAFEKALEEKKP